MYSGTENIRPISNFNTENENQENTRQCLSRKGVQKYKEDKMKPFLEEIKRIQLQYQHDTKELCLNLKPVLQNCIESYQDDTTYYNNEHYIKVWINYADMSNNAEDIFQTMQMKGIGEFTSLFYQGYTIVLENNGKENETDAMYQLGLSKLSGEEANKLHIAYKDFKKRVRSLKKRKHTNKNHLQKVTSKKLHSSNNNTNAIVNDPNQYLTYIREAVLYNNDEICFEEYRAQKYLNKNISKEKMNLNKTNDLSHSMMDMEEVELGNMPAFLSPIRNQTSKLNNQTSNSINNNTNTSMKPSTMTINTKTALDDVMSMFSDTPNNKSESTAAATTVKDTLTTNFYDQENDNEEEFTTFLQPPSPVQFAIFSDENNTNNNKNSNNNSKINHEVKYPPLDMGDPMQWSEVINCKSDQLPFTMKQLQNKDLVDIELNGDLFHVENIDNDCIKVLDLDGDLDNEMIIKIKVQIPSDLWPITISKALKSYENDLILPSKVIVYDNASCTFTYQKFEETLADMVLMYDNRTIDELILVYYGVEMLRLIQLMHDKGWVCGNINQHSFIMKGLGEWVDGWGEWNSERKAGWNEKGLSLCCDWSKVKRISNEGDKMTDANGWVNVMKFMGSKKISNPIINNVLDELSNKGDQTTTWKACQQQLESILMHSDLKLKYMQHSIVMGSG